MYVYNRDAHQVSTRQADKARPAKYRTVLASTSLCLKNVYLSIFYIDYLFILAKTAVVIFHEYSCMVKLTSALFVLCLIPRLYIYLHTITDFALSSIVANNCA